jgi:hypothetical protein
MRLERRKPVGEIDSKEQSVHRQTVWRSNCMRKPIQAERVVEEEIKIEGLYCWLRLDF